MKLGGLVGTLTLECDLSPFAPLLRAAEILHTGKDAAFGLGKIEVLAGAATPPTLRRRVVPSGVAI
jgi:hypothetical protein